jgi:hypothetical protein
VEKQVMTNATSGKWKPGQTGNPRGRPVGQSEITRMRIALAAHVPSIVEQLVQAALGGDVQAARLVLERVLPPVKAVEQPVELRMPSGGTLTAQAECVLSAAASGDIAPGQAAQLIAALGTVAKIAEIDDLVSRVAKLETGHAGN